jgi:flagellar hook-basal body complex protein FliE
MAIDPASGAITRAIASPPTVARGASSGGASGTASIGDFGSLVGRLVEGLEQGEAEANAAVDAMVNKTGDVHDAMIALQRSELSLQLVVQVRNKLVQAYQDIMRMPI